MNAPSIACCLATLVLASMPARLHAQAESTTAASRPSGPARDPARAARKAQLMAEFRALLEQTQNRQEARNLSTANSAEASRVETAPSRTAATAATTGSSGQQAPAVRWPKDPSLDYSGFSCEYFTRQPQAQSAAPFHAEGSWVAYGERMYQCVNQRWRLAGPVAAYADGALRQAGQVEK